jgi:hypothetical protein
VKHWARGRSEPGDSNGASNESGPRRCAADGTVLHAGGQRDGWCSTARAFAVAYQVAINGAEGQRVIQGATPCPYWCPECRGRLEWSGACHRCHGTRTPDDKTSWTFPGDRFEPDEAGEHYLPVAAGPRPCVPPPDDLLAALKARPVVHQPVRPDEWRQDGGEWVHQCGRSVNSGGHPPRAGCWTCNRAEASGTVSEDSEPRTLRRMRPRR